MPTAPPNGIDTPTADPFRSGYEPGSAAVSERIDKSSDWAEPSVTTSSSPGDMASPLRPSASAESASARPASADSDSQSGPSPAVHTPRVVAGTENATTESAPSNGSDRSQVPKADPWVAGEPASTGRSRKGLRYLGIALTVLVVGIIAYLCWLFFSGDGFMTDLGRNDEPAAATGPGSVSDPYPASQAVSIFYTADGDEQRWAIKSEPVDSAEAEIIAATDAGDGSAIVGSQMIVKFESGSLSRSLSELMFKAVDTNGTEYDAQSCPAGDPFPADAVAAGERITGNVCWTVPSTSLDGLMLGIQSTQAPSTVHIELP